MKKLKINLSLVSLLLAAILSLNACNVMRNQSGSVPGIKGEEKLNYKTPGYDAAKKTILIISDNDGTEMFDMIAPFYLFSATEKANVYIVAEKKSPVIVKRGLFVLPQFTFGEIDSMQMKVDVMVIPNQSGNPKQVTVNFIKNHYTGSNTILSVCDGAATAAATGIYNGVELTTHSSDYAGLKKQYKKPAWVLNKSVTQQGNLFSTAGVANATEGSLTVIGRLFGKETTQKLIAAIHYPYKEIKTDHQNLRLDTNSIYMGLRKGTIKKNEKIAVLLQNGINEFDLAAILDTYYRSFPKTLETISFNDAPVTSSYGLTLLPTGVMVGDKHSEIHILKPDAVSQVERALFKNAQLITYENKEKLYIIDVCLKRISNLYGSNFAVLVKLMLDYN